MSGERMPPGIDLIEQLHAMGTLSIAEAHGIWGTEHAAWRGLAPLLRSGIAALWVREGDNQRPFERGETDALLRTRMRDTHESDLRDDQLIVHATPKTNEAHQNEFGN